MLNSFNCIGRLGADPELRYSPSGTAVVKYRLAVHRRKAGGGRETDWFSCVSFGRTAEFLAQYVGKGRLIVLSGYVQCRQWVTEDGAKRETVEIVGERVNTLEKAGEEQQEPQPEPEALAFSGDPFSDE